jgi:hypothetical protein
MKRCVLLVVLSAGFAPAANDLALDGIVAGDADSGSA